MIKNTTYRFSINGQSVSPLYSDNLSIDTIRESGQMFFRKKLSSGIAFIDKDFDYLHNSAFNTLFEMLVEVNYSGTWSNYYKGEFRKIDCKWDLDGKHVEVTITPVDYYTKVLALQDKEFNLVDLSPAIQSVHLRKRIAIQIYEMGSSVITTYLGGTHFEQEASIVTSNTDLLNIYKFAFIKSYNEWGLKEIVGGNYAYDFEVPYVGGPPVGTSPLFNWTAAAANGLSLLMEVDFNNGHYSCKVKDATNTIIYQTALYSMVDYFTTYVTLEPVNPAYDTLQFKLTRDVHFYGRAICNVDNIGAMSTSDLPLEDICDNNLNYRKVIGYNIDSLASSVATQVEPTKYGKDTNDKYFVGYQYGGIAYIPIGREGWVDVSYWFNRPGDYDIVDENSYEPILIKDSYPLYSAISVLVAAIDPSVSHSNTSTYSTILYGSNPLAPEALNLLMVPKSNIIHSNYEVAAKKTTITLKSIFEMLRTCYNIYWFIDDTGKLRFEHVRWFQRGGSYVASPAVQVDLTTLYNKNLRKSWAYSTSKYAFAKEEIPKYLKTKWAEESTEGFGGYDIEMLESTNEESTVVQLTHFMSDIDYVFLMGPSLSEDGFVLINAEITGGKYYSKLISITANNKIFRLQNGRVSFIYLGQIYRRDYLPNWTIKINNAPSSAYTIKRTKVQEVEVPSILDLDVFKTINTYLGAGLIDKISLNLSSRMNKVTLLYEYMPKP